MTNDPGTDRLILCGYISQWQNGFAISCFGTGPKPNKWFTAITTLDDNGTRRISGFEESQLTHVQHLSISVCRSTTRGEAEPLVLLVQGIPIIGTRLELCERLNSDDEQIINADCLSKADICENTNFERWLLELQHATKRAAANYNKQLLVSWLDNVLSPRLKRGLEFHTNSTIDVSTDISPAFTITQSADRQTESHLLNNVERRFNEALQQDNSLSNKKDRVALRGAKELMRTHGLTIAQLAKIADLNKSTVNRIISGTPMSPYIAERILHIIEEQVGTIKSIRIVEAKSDE